MKLGYLAGPFRSKSQWGQDVNIRRAEALALEVWRLGAACICPHANTAHYQGELPDHIWLDGDIEMLSRCDFILMTEDWMRSKGAVAEHNFAQEQGIKVCYTLGSLAGWLWDEDLAKARERLCLSGGLNPAPSTKSYLWGALEPWYN